MPLIDEQPTAVSGTRAAEDTIVRTRRRPQDKKRPKRQPPYAVVLHNDPVNTMEFVVGVLKKVFGYGTQRAIWLMMKAHFSGQAQVWTGTRELAELKADQIQSCGADPMTASRGSQPLTVTVEPLPED